MIVITNLIQKGIIDSKVYLNNDTLLSLCKIIENNIKTVTIYHKNVCWKAVFGILNTCTISQQKYESLPTLLNLILENTFSETINLKYISNDSNVKNYFILFEPFFKQGELRLKQGKYDNFIQLIRNEENHDLSHQSNLNLLWYRYFYSLFRQTNLDETLFTFKLLINDLVKIFNPYMDDDHIKEIIFNLKVITRYLNYLIQNSIMEYHNLKFIIEQLDSSINEVVIFLFNEFQVDVNKLELGQKEYTININKVYIKRELYDILEEYILFISRFNLIEKNNMIGKSICKYLSQMTEFNFLNIINIDLFTLDRVIQYLQFNLNSYFNLRLFNEPSHKFINFGEFEKNICYNSLLEFLTNVTSNHEHLEKLEKTLQIEKSIKIYNNIILNLTKTFSFLSKTKNQALFQQKYLCIDFITDNLEKMNEGDLKYIFVYSQNYIQYLLNNSNEIDFDFLLKYIDRSLRVLKEKKENISYLNVNSFLQGFFSKKAVELFSSRKEGIEILTVLFNKIIDMNENKYHIFMRVASSMFFSFILENPELYFHLDEILINLSESRVKAN